MRSIQIMLIAAALSCQNSHRALPKLFAFICCVQSVDNADTKQEQPKVDELPPAAAPQQQPLQQQPPQQAGQPGAAEPQQQEGAAQQQQPPQAEGQQPGPQAAKEKAIWKGPIKKPQLPKLQSPHSLLNKDLASCWVQVGWA